MDEQGVLPTSLIADLMLRIRSGDEGAARELLDLYRPHLMRMVRVRLTDPRLIRQYDASDVCQSVFADFFLTARLGELDFESGEALLRYLARIARNRLIDRARRFQTQRRNIQQQQTVPVEELDPVSPNTTPSRFVSGREILSLAMDRMTPDERRIAERRMHGDDWASIARESGEAADTVRMRFTRSITRIATSLDL